ncbi:hypothetical protein NLG97_g4797 [Lecanicillium saksenae]|uniref:Uncharacterized protein n=1 Tax=Lecanicillium saksenae TaxID=468837 RepID=A0ACC1QUA5_9HYPO|nr:hypothetical protein NLG97_g4797 [Lecanicillium saksenae]
MSESLNRKACDRCHSQKLSCKRIGDGICERCLRLNAECKSSPSLRYKKQVQQYEQQQQQEQQQQPHHQSPSQQSLQHQQSREMQQQQLTPQLDFSQGQSATTQSVLDAETQRHVEVQDSTERRSPKRRRTGSEVHLVQRDVDRTLGLAEYAMSLRNMDYMALSQSSMQSNHLIGAQIPPANDNYFSLHQGIPNVWANQSHEEVQQLPHQHPGHHHHHQQQQVFDQVSVAPLVVPDLSATQQDIFSSAQQLPQQEQLHQQRTTPILCNRRRQVPLLNHAASSGPNERRSRSNKVQINYTDFVIPENGNLSTPYIMDQFFQIYARVRVLSTHLESLEQGKVYSDGPNGKPNEFTVAEIYKYTHQVIDVLERVVTVKSASTGATQPVDSPLDAADPASSMFTLSLYALLLDIFQRLFTHVRSILSKADPKKDDTFPSWLLPEMNIGAASIGAHPAFHMSLTVQLAMQFLSRLREATVFLGLSTAAATNGNAATANGGSERRGSSSSDTVSISFSAIKNKEGNLSKTLGQLQDELNEFMDAMDAIDAMEDPAKE